MGFLATYLKWKKQWKVNVFFGFLIQPTTLLYLVIVQITENSPKTLSALSASRKANDVEGKPPRICSSGLAAYLLDAVQKILIYADKYIYMQEINISFDLQLTCNTEK